MACHERTTRMVRLDSMEQPTNDEQGTRFSLRKTLSEKLRADMGALDELDACCRRVQAGSTAKRVRSWMFGKRLNERFVAVCPHTSRVLWWTLPLSNDVDLKYHQSPAEEVPWNELVDQAIFDDWVGTLGQHKQDKLISVFPATLKHVAEVHRERSLVLVTEANELVLVLPDAEAQQIWLAACSSIAGRSREALVVAGVRAAENKEAAAAARLEEAQAMEAVAAQAKAKATADAVAAQKAAAREALRAREAARAEADAAKAEAERQAAAAKAEAEAELKESMKQLDEAIKENGGEKLLLKDARECVVCYEEFLGFADGVSCAGTRKDLGAPHFVCNGCFVASVQSAITDDLSKQTLREGRVGCPYSTFPATANSCDAACFDGKVVAEKVDEQLFAAYQRQRDRLLEAKCATEQRLEMDRRLELAIQKMEREGVQVFKARRFIEDEILTMHCPRCKMAFADWDGCNALYCTYAGCGCNFCAFCLKDCGGGVKFGEKEIVRRGNDAVHKHINNECKYAKGIGIGGGGKDRLQKEVWNKVRTERIHDCLRDMCDNDGERQKVIDSLEMQFKQLNLTITLRTGGVQRSGSVKPGAKVGTNAAVKNAIKASTLNLLEAPEWLDVQHSLDDDADAVAKVGTYSGRYSRELAGHKVLNGKAVYKSSAGAFLYFYNNQGYQAWSFDKRQVNGINDWCDGGWINMKSLAWCVHQPHPPQGVSVLRFDGSRKFHSVCPCAPEPYNTYSLSTAPLHTV